MSLSESTFVLTPRCMEKYCGTANDGTDLPGTENYKTDRKKHEKWLPARNQIGLCVA